MIVCALVAGPSRFVDLRRRLPGISSNVLAQRLGDLRDAGVVELKILPPPAARQVYVLSPDGAKLAPAIALLADWGKRRQAGADVGQLFRRSRSVCPRTIV